MKVAVVAAISAVVFAGLIFMFTRRQAASTENETTGRVKQPTGTDPLPEQVYSGSSKPPSVVFKEGIRSAGSPYGETGTSSDLRWISSSENPFGIRVLDCRSVSHNMVSTTSSPQIAAKFTELRSSDGVWSKNSTEGFSMSGTVYN
jgi:hypothetical protein